MKAYILRRSGRPETLKKEEVAEPTPKENEVKVKIKTIGVNYAEILSRRGQYSWAPKRPYIPGMEAYGEVVECGKNCSMHRPGDYVSIGGQYGNYAEYNCVPQHLCFPLIQGFSSEENAAYLVNFMTAWVALKKLCGIQKGDHVLIQAAAGGVGTAAIQIAKKMGCHVYGTASKKEKLELIKKLGADRAINYSQEDFCEVIQREYGQVDCVLETVGGDVFKKSLNLLKPFGKIVVAGFASVNLKWWNPLSVWKTWKDAPKANIMDLAKKSQGLYATHIGYLIPNKKLTAEIWAELKSFIEKHQLKPIVGKTFTFDELPRAHAFMESRESMGKIVVTVGE